MHPDLAGKLADEGNLTIESKSEQESAGLNVITKDEKQKLNDLNKRYVIYVSWLKNLFARFNKIRTIFVVIISDLKLILSESQLYLFLV